MIFCNLDDRTFYLYPGNPSYNNPDCMRNEHQPFRLYKTMKYITFECVLTRKGTFVKNIQEIYYD